MEDQELEQLDDLEEADLDESAEDQPYYILTLSTVSDGDPVDEQLLQFFIDFPDDTQLVLEEIRDHLQEQDYEQSILLLEELRDQLILQNETGSELLTIMQQQVEIQEEQSKMLNSGFMMLTIFLGLFIGFKIVQLFWMGRH